MLDSKYYTLFWYAKDTDYWCYNNTSFIREIDEMMRISWWMHGAGYVYLVKSRDHTRYFCGCSIVCYFIYFYFHVVLFIPYCHFCAVYSNWCIILYHYVCIVWTQLRTCVLMYQSFKQILSSTIDRLTRRVFLLFSHICFRVDLILLTLWISGSLSLTKCI